MHYAGLIPDDTAMKSFGVLLHYESKLDRIALALAINRSRGNDLDRPMETGQIVRSSSPEVIVVIWN